MTSFATTGLTWITAARERAERAAANLRSIENDPASDFASIQLAEAEDELRTAANHCADSIRSLKREAAR